MWVARSAGIVNDLSVRPNGSQLEYGRFAPALHLPGNLWLPPHEEWRCPMVVSHLGVVCFGFHGERFRRSGCAVRNYSGLGVRSATSTNTQSKSLLVRYVVGRGYRSALARCDVVPLWNGFLE